MRILIQPIGDLEEDLIFSLERGLADRFNAQISILAPTTLDMSCFNPMRYQFNSTCLLRKLKPVWITLGVTDRDIYADRMNFVFGEAELNGNRAIVSIYRLRSMDSRVTEERLIKEAVHEIGHVLGLKHCRNRGCVMSFSNSLAEVDIKGSYFCASCASKIRAYLKE
jgi:archaemetzincin